MSMVDTNETVPGADPALMGDGTAGTEDLVPRETPEPNQARKELVDQIVAEVEADKRRWHDVFTKMREDQNFAAGAQWSDDPHDNRYVANITLRHIQMRVASLYAKNPKVIARRRERLDTQIWDGTTTSVRLAVQTLQTATDPMQIQQAMTLVQEARAAIEQREMLDKLAKTLELLYNYNVYEQAHPFKSMMKMVVRRAATTGVGYVKIGFQRVLEPRPETEARVPDATEKLATLEQLAADYADGEIGEEGGQADVERLRLAVQSITAQPEQVVREGLVFDYPPSDAIIPDRQCKQLQDFLGCDRVTQEYHLTPAEIQRIYGVDVRKSYRPYAPENAEGNPGYTGAAQQAWVASGGDTGTTPDETGRQTAIVWETYSRTDGLVYVTCKGYPDFLREPAPPEVTIDRFFPWFPLVLNEVDHPEQVFPPSDVSLMRDQQREYNRLRESLYEHRVANRPAYIAAAGVLNEQDKKNLTKRPANAVIELNGLQPGQPVTAALQPMGFQGIDPNLYEVNGTFEDILRVVGSQEAVFGGAAKGTATETSIAEAARMSTVQSAIDDMDMMLSELARAAGQILLAEVSGDTVKRIVGPGAVWPELTQEEIAKQVYLEIEAGSTGRPNKAAEIQNFERLAPILMQIPGVSPEFLAREGIRRLDDRLSVDDVVDKNQFVMSIMALNQQMGRGPGAGGAGGAQPGAETGDRETAPSQQGPEGSSNGPRPASPAGAGGGPDMPMGPRSVS